MVGVSSGLAATLGVLAPSQESFVQMATCMGAGMYRKGNVCTSRGNNSAICDFTRQDSL